MKERVSLFPNARVATPIASPTIHEILAEIKEGKYAERILDLRALAEVAEIDYMKRFGAGKKTATELRYSEEKETLKAFTLAGTFSIRNTKSESLLQHSGYIILDIDHLTADNYLEIRETICADPHTAFLFTSVSGNGLKFGIRIARPNNGNGNEYHHNAWQQIADYYQANYNLTLDASGKDICRICFVSYDPDVYTNDQAIQFPITYTDKPREERTRTEELPALTIEQAREILSYYPQRLNYFSWLRVLSSLVNAFGESLGVQLMQERYPEDRHGEYIAKTKHILNRVQVGSLIYGAQQHGMPPYAREQKPAQKEPTPPPDIPPHEELQPQPEPNFSLDDVGNGLRFAWHYRNQVIWCEEQPRWFVYDDTRFAPDKTLRVEILAKNLLYAMSQKGLDEHNERLEKWAMKSRFGSGLSLMLKRAKPEITVTLDELDSNPYLLNVQNGTLDFSNGGLRLLDHSPSHRITKLAPCDYDPDAIAPLFLNVLHRVMPDADMRTYFQTRVAQSLIGKISLREFYICYGLGANGKGTLLEQCFLPLFGDYGMPAMASTFQLHENDDGPRSDLVDMYGMRYVLARESNENKPLDEALIKTITGGDRIKHRRQHSPDYLTYLPQCQVWMMTNHLPIIRGIELAMWDRLKIFNFSITIPVEEQDATIKDRIQYQLSGVLNWLIEGLHLFREGNVKEPALVRLAGMQYREESDILAEFFDKHIICSESYRVQGVALYECYRKFCAASSDVPISKVSFGKNLAMRGYKKSRDGFQHGLMLREERQTSIDPEFHETRQPF